MNLWLDDVREPPLEGRWVWAKSVQRAQLFCYRFGKFEMMSLDHDLGDYAHEGGDGIAFIDWLCEVGQDPEIDLWPMAIFIHSGNPVGRDNMLRAIDRFGPYAQGFGSHRRIKD